MATEGSFAAILHSVNPLLGAAEILLLLRTDRPEWNLPGGKVNPGEDPRRACAREVKEETGLDVVPLWQIGIDHKKVNDAGEVIDIARIFFCKVVGGELKNTNESKAQAWFELCQLGSINVVKVICPGYPKGRTVAMIRDALNTFIAPSY